MKFNELDFVVSGVTHSFAPYDRGLKGAFVWRQKGVTLHAPRLVATATTDDTASDRYVVQGNTPRVCPATPETCGPDILLGTDLVKTELRFLATTSSVDRKLSIDLHIAQLQELRDMVADREHIYV